MRFSSTSLTRRRSCASHTCPATTAADGSLSLRSAKPSKAEPLRLVLAPNATPASALYSSLAQAIYPSVAHQRQPDLASAAPAPKSPLLNVDTTLGAASPPSPSSAPVSSGKEGSLIAQRFARLPIGSRLEVSPSSWEIARDLARVVAGPEGGKGGAGLVVDYGDAKAFGRSWRVSRGDRLCSVFSRWRC